MKRLKVAKRIKHKAEEYIIKRNTYKSTNFLANLMQTSLNTKLKEEIAKTMSLFAPKDGLGY